MIVSGDNGETKIISKTEWNDYVAKGGWEYVAHPGHHSSHVDNTTLARSINLESRDKSLAKRACGYHQIITKGTDQTFMNWDVPMSSVVKANAESVYTYIQLTEGYSIENSLSIATTASAAVTGWLSVSVGVTVGKSWTSQQTAGYAYYIPAGKYGIVVSNPWVRRQRGSVAIGCAGSPSSVEQFTADSYTSKSYGDLAWVTGVIGLCTSTEYPMPCCQGSCTHT